MLIYQSKVCSWSIKLLQIKSLFLTGCSVALHICEGKAKSCRFSSTDFYSIYPNVSNHMLYRPPSYLPGVSQCLIVNYKITWMSINPLHLAATILNSPLKIVSEILIWSTNYFWSSYCWHFLLHDLNLDNYRDSVCKKGLIRSFFNCMSWQTVICFVNVVSLLNMVPLCL